MVKLVNLLTKVFNHKDPPWHGKNENYPKKEENSVPIASKVKTNG